MASKKRAQEVCEEGYWDCNAWGDCWYVEEDCYFEEKDEATEEVSEEIWEEDWEKDWEEASDEKWEED